MTTAGRPVHAETTICRDPGASPSPFEQEANLYFARIADRMCVRQYTASHTFGGYMTSSAT